ncbi:zinc finger protein [Branchiostoma belcheri]|nr:zinc finger protein [Branchiostoma belcheri]
MDEDESTRPKSLHTAPKETISQKTDVTPASLKVQDSLPEDGANKWPNTPLEETKPGYSLGCHWRKGYGTQIDMFQSSGESSQSTKMKGAPSRGNKGEQVDVACLQECHVSSLEDKKRWTQQWGHKAYWSLGRWFLVDDDIEVNTFGAGATIVTALGIPMELDDNYVRHRLRAYGEVLNGRFVTYASKGFPEMKTGARQYKMKISSHIPNSIRLGDEIITFKYVGQPKVCHKCGGQGHVVADCVARKCSKCFEIGHLVRDCENNIKCNVCGEEGHTGRACQLSFANKVALSTAWGKPSNTSLPNSAGEKAPSLSELLAKPLVAGVSSDNEEDDDRSSVELGMGEEKNEVAVSEKVVQVVQAVVHSEPPEKAIQAVVHSEPPEKAIQTVVHSEPPEKAIQGLPSQRRPYKTSPSQKDGDNKMTSQLEVSDGEDENMNLELEESLPTTPLVIALSEDEIKFKRHLHSSSEGEEGGSEPDTLDERGMPTGVPRLHLGRRETLDSSVGKWNGKQSFKQNFGKVWDRPELLKVFNESLDEGEGKLSPSQREVSSNVDSDGRVISVLISDEKGGWGLVDVTTKAQCLQHCRQIESVDHAVLQTWTWVEGFAKRWVQPDFRLNSHGIPTSDIEGIQKKEKGRCEITFKSQAAFHRFCPSIAIDDSVEVNTYGAGVTVVTAVGIDIPLELDDNFVRHRLKCYGEVLNGRFVTYASQGFPEMKTGTRQYKMRLKSHIPNSIRIEVSSDSESEEEKSEAPQGEGSQGEEEDEKSTPDMFNVPQSTPNNMGGDKVVVEAVVHASDKQHSEQEFPLSGKVGDQITEPDSSLSGKMDDKWDLGSLPEDGANKLLPQVLTEADLDLNLDETTPSNPLVIDLSEAESVASKRPLRASSESEAGEWEIQKKNKKSCPKFAPSLSSDRSVDVEQYGSSITVVTAVGIPVELDDNFVRHRLKGFGVVKDARFLTHANIGFPEIKTGVRQYKIEIRTHLPNSMRIGNNTVSFHYNG